MPKKIKQEKPKKKSQNRGLPKEFIQKYGTEKTWTMVSRGAWDEFYKSPKGRTRIQNLITKENRHLARRNAQMNIGAPGVNPRTDVGLKNTLTENEVAKAYAKAN